MYSFGVGIRRKFHRFGFVGVLVCSVVMVFLVVSCDFVFTGVIMCFGVFCICNFACFDCVWGGFWWVLLDC